MAKTRPGASLLAPHMVGKVGPEVNRGRDRCAFLLPRLAAQGGWSCPGMCARVESPSSEKVPTAFGRLRYSAADFFPQPSNM